MQQQPERSRKAPVIWTQHEETLVALEVERMRTEADCVGPTGRYATTLTSQLLIAQRRVLPPERQRSHASFYYKGGKRRAAYDQQWYDNALARRELYEQREQEQAPVEEIAEPAAEEKAPLVLDPEMEEMLALGSLLKQLLNYVDQSVESGVRKALIALRDEEERKLRVNGNHTAPPPAIRTTAREIVRRKIDVIGLLPGQQRIVEASPVARLWNIRFLSSGTSHSRADLRERVIICTKFVSHHQQNRYLQMKAEIHWANGGPQSVIHELERLSRLAPNGNEAMH